MLRSVAPRQNIISRFQMLGLKYFLGCCVEHRWKETIEYGHARIDTDIDLGGQTERGTDGRIDGWTDRHIDRWTDGTGEENLSTASKAATMVFLDENGFNFNNWVRQEPGWPNPTENDSGIVDCKSQEKKIPNQIHQPKNRYLFKDRTLDGAWCFTKD